MLHQISWFNYFTGVAVAAAIYYAIVGIKFFRPELHRFFKRGSDGQSSVLSLNQPSVSGESPVVGAARQDPFDHIPPEQLFFTTEGETDSDDPEDFKEMVSETATLIKVIGETQESKDDFGMLFKLIISKYPDLRGTRYQQQINDYLLAEANHHFPFSLTPDEVNEYWNDQKLQSA